MSSTRKRSTNKGQLEPTIRRNTRSNKKQVTEKNTGAAKVDTPAKRQFCRCSTIRRWTHFFQDKRGRNPTNQQKLTSVHTKVTRQRCPKVVRTTTTQSFPQAQPHEGHCHGQHCLQTREARKKVVLLTVCYISLLSNGRRLTN